MRGRDLWLVALLSPFLASGCNNIKAEPKKAEPPEVLYTFPTTDEVVELRGVHRPYRRRESPSKSGPG